MKKIKPLAIVALLIGFCQVGMAQSSSSIPEFRSDAEKQAWIEANPQLYSELNGSVKVLTAQEKQAFMEANPTQTEIKLNVNLPKTVNGVKVSGTVSTNEERFATEEEKQAWLDKNSTDK